MTTFSLKLTAVVLMTLDHIGLYIPAAPAWLRWLGRGAYPLFLFCMVQGYAHTRSRKRYLLRLYLMSLFMTALGLFLNTRFLPEGGYGNHNIFLSLFLTGVLISAVELYQRDRKRGGLLLGAVALVQVLYGLLPFLLPFTRNFSGDVLTGVASSLSPWGWPCTSSGTAGRPWPPCTWFSASTNSAPRRCTACSPSSG